MDDITDKTNGIELKTRGDLKIACNNGDYIVIVKRPRTKSRIHVGKCPHVIFMHFLDTDINMDNKLGCGRQKQKYFAFKNREDALKFMPFYTKTSRIYCPTCIKEVNR